MNVLERTLAELEQDLNSTTLLRVPNNPADPNTTYRNVILSDFLRRNEALNDTIQLHELSKSKASRELLKRTWRTNDDVMIKKYAGKALGYSWFRIAFSEVQEIFPLINAENAAIAGIAAGLGYLAYNLLNN
jgi:hypothetical protein